MKFVGPKIFLKFRAMFEGKHAWLANTLSGTMLFIIGDTVEQHLEMRRGLLQQYDWSRCGRIGAIGIFVCFVCTSKEGPPHHFFYKYLDHYLPGTSKSTVGKKILVDQLVACPMFSIQFFMGMSFLEGKDVAECWKEFTKKFPTVYLVDWLLWPPCQFINFYLIPSRYRVLYVNGVTVLWNVFLSYMKHYDQHEQKECCKSERCNCSSTKI